MSESVGLAGDGPDSIPLLILQDEVDHGLFICKILFLKILTISFIDKFQQRSRTLILPANCGPILLACQKCHNRTAITSRTSHSS
jgi:hypothetical protein